MIHDWGILVCWGVVVSGLATGLWWQHHRYRQGMPALPDHHQQMEAYQQMLVDLNQIETLPSPRERAQAISDAQERYFRSIEVKRAS